MEDTQTGTILLMDDSSASNLVMKQILEEAGHSIVLVSDMDNPIQAITDHKPDLVILDIMMTGADGHSVLESIKNCDTAREIPVIILTSRNNSKDMQRAKSLGAADYIVKPFDIKDVIDRVNSQIPIKAGFSAKQDLRQPA